MFWRPCAGGTCAHYRDDCPRRALGRGRVRGVATIVTIRRHRRPWRCDGASLLLGSFPTSPRISGSCSSSGGGDSSSPGAPVGVGRTNRPRSRRPSALPSIPVWKNARVMPPCSPISSARFDPWPWRGSKTPRYSARLQAGAGPHLGQAGHRQKPRIWVMRPWVLALLRERSRRLLEAIAANRSDGCPEVPGRQRASLTAKMV
jgi:hypothetical protein